MRVSHFLVLLAAAGLVSGGAWVIVLLYIDPTQTGAVGFILFYATLACTLFAAIVLFGLLARVVLKRIQRQSVLAFHLMLPTLRQALWCSLIVVLSLILASQELFSWFVGLIIVIFFTLLEGFLYSLHKPSPHGSEATAE
ncbi:MAG: hypothetical protein ACD_41C00295G0003 [uncultured bacterium]|nr:MAG: hypothetical protein ACD_41C00295G0003 [uncultured bacterium]